MVGILSEDDHLDLVKRCPVECRKYLVPRRINYLCVLFLNKEVFKGPKVWLVEFFNQVFLPAIMNIRINPAHTINIINFSAPVEGSYPGPEGEDEVAARGADAGGKGFVEAVEDVLD